MIFNTAPGCEEVVKTLLMQEDVKPDKPDNLGQTPLSHAAWEGHQDAVKPLHMREDLNPYKPDNSSETVQCSQASSPSVFSLGPDGGQV